MAGGQSQWLVANRNGWWPIAMAGGQSQWLVANRDGRRIGLIAQRLRRIFE
jgi:hypothetical protein